MNHMKLSQRGVLEMRTLIEPLYITVQWTFLAWKFHRKKKTLSLFYDLEILKAWNLIHCILAVGVKNKFILIHIQKNCFSRPQKSVIDWSILRKAVSFSTVTAKINKIIKWQY